MKTRLRYVHLFSYLAIKMIRSIIVLSVLRNRMIYKNSMVLKASDFHVRLILCILSNACMMYSKKLYRRVNWLGENSYFYIIISENPSPVTRSQKAFRLQSSICPKTNRWMLLINLQKMDFTVSFSWILQTISFSRMRQSQLNLHHANSPSLTSKRKKTSVHAELKIIKIKWSIVLFFEMDVLLEVLSILFDKEITKMSNWLAV